MLSKTDTIILVPGLRGHVRDHWQTHLEAALPNALSVPGLGRIHPSLDDRVALLNAAVENARGPVTLVAHSAGVLTTVHWAARHARPASRVAGALLVTPPDLCGELPAEYPSLAELAGNGWLPIPRRPLPFPSIVAASTNDGLGDLYRVRALATAWGSRFHCLGPVGHLNPASGYGEWPAAQVLLDELATALVG
jgi:predicted alpha/beta hydrolase family esterase